jgi:hypothetical protein
MLKRIVAVQVCDTTGDDSSTIAGYIKIILLNLYLICYGTTNGSTL